MQGNDASEGKDLAYKILYLKCSFSVFSGSSESIALLAQRGDTAMKTYWNVILCRSEGSSLGTTNLSYGLVSTGALPRQV